MNEFWPASMATPAIYITVLRAFLNTNFWYHPVGHVMRHLVEPPLYSVDVSRMPQGIAGVMPLLRSDHDRMHCAIVLACEFDIFEAASAAVDLAASVDDRRFLLAAASLCGNPSVDNEVRARVAALAGQDRMVRIRFDPSMELAAKDEEYLYAQCWPGVRKAGNQFATAPRVVIDGLLDPSPAMRLAVRVKESAGNVQRLAPESEVPLWFGSETVLVATPETSERVRDAYPDFPERQIITDDSPSDNDGFIEMLRQIDDRLPEKAKLRMRDAYE